MAHATHPSARVGLWECRGVGTAGGPALTLLCVLVTPSPFGPAGQLLTRGDPSPATLVSRPSSARPSSPQDGLFPSCVCPALLAPRWSPPVLRLPGPARPSSPLFPQPRFCSVLIKVSCTPCSLLDGQREQGSWWDITWSCPISGPFPAQRLWLSVGLLPAGVWGSLWPEPCSQPTRGPRAWVPRASAWPRGHLLPFPCGPSGFLSRLPVLGCLEVATLAPFPVRSSRSPRSPSRVPSGFPPLLGLPARPACFAV